MGEDKEVGGGQWDASQGVELVRVRGACVEEKHLGVNCETKSSHGRAAVSKEGVCLEEHDGGAEEDVSDADGCLDDNEEVTAEVGHGHGEVDVLPCAALRVEVPANDGI